MSHLRPEHLERLSALINSIPKNSLGVVVLRAFEDPFEPSASFFDRLKTMPDEDVVTSLEWALHRLLRDYKR